MTLAYSSLASKQRWDFLEMFEHLWRHVLMIPQIDLCPVQNVSEVVNALQTFLNFVDRPWKMNMEPENSPKRKTRNSYQPAIFGFHVSFRGCTS